MPVNICRFADYELDRSAYQLRRKGRPVQLERIPLDLLFLLADQRGQLVTREEILEQVWGKGVFLDTDNAINTAVRKIRHALRDDSDSPRFISTVPGKGYRFVGEIEIAKAGRGREFRARPQRAIVGRDRELTTLLSGLDDAASRRGSLFLISGEPGVGKTRLADEVAAAAEAQQMSIFVGHCSEHDEAVAYLPFVEILENFVDRAPDLDGLRIALGGQGPELARLLPNLRNLLPELPAPLDLPPAQARRHLFNCFFDFVARIASAQPTLIVLEDLHWADDSTLSLLDHLVQRLSDLPLMLIGTYRDAELDVTRPLAKTLEDLLRGRLATRVSLKCLPLDEVAAMLKSLSGKSPPAAVVGEIFAETEGNPFFVEELFRHLEEENRLYDLLGQFRAQLRIGEQDAPPSVRLVVARRLARLGDLTQRTLATAAVIGRLFSLEILQASSEADADSILECVEEAEKAGLIFSAGELSKDRFEFSHELIRQAVISGLSAARCQRLHLEVAESIERTYSPTLESRSGGTLDEHFVELALHYTEAGYRAQAIPYWLRSGERELQRSANVEAINHLKKGLELLGSRPNTPERTRPAEEAQRFSLLLVLGQAQQYAGKFLESQETLLCGAEVAKSLGSTESLARAALELEYTTYLGGLPELPVVRLLEEALQRLGVEDNPLAPKVLSSLSRALGLTGQKRKAMVYAQQAVEMAGRFSDPGLVADSLLGMLLALMGPEHAAQRLHLAKEILDLAKASNDTLLVCNAHWWLGHCLLESGEVVAADAEVEAHRRHGEEANEPFVVSLNRMFRAMRALMLGRFEDSERLAQEAFAAGQTVQNESAAGILGLQMFALRREQGRLKELEAAVRFFVQQESAESVSRPNIAVIYAELGMTLEARVEFDLLAQHDFADVARDSLWMGTMTYLADVCTFLGDRARADTLYQILAPFAGQNVVVANGAACYGALSRYLGALATTLERWDDAACHFEHALAMNARMDARPWLAHTQEQYATMLLARHLPGDRDKAAALLDAALTTARELGMRALEEQIPPRKRRRNAT